MKLENLSIVEAKKLLDTQDITSSELVQYYLDRIEKTKDLNIYISVNEKALKKAEDSRDGRLAGIPIAVKDIYTTKDMETTAASHVLNGYTPVFESTVTQKILNEGAIIIGKTNLDEFCHGSSTETSYYDTSKNPLDPTRSPGGSSGGSGAAVAVDVCTGALGTETAGSLRQPAAWNGCIGLKPTYGRVSRYGVIAMGSSLDCPGPLVKTVEDAAYMLEIIAGHDKKDFTSSKEPVGNYYDNLDKEQIKGRKLGVPKEWMELEMEPGVRKAFEKSLEKFEDLGAEIVDISLMDPNYAIAVYTLVCRSEVSSNLSRFDGIRYGLSTDKADSVVDYMMEVRGKGFGMEAKRRTMTGTFALSAGYADEYYKKAELVRQALKEDILKALEKVDAIIGPTTPMIAMKIGQASKNPLFGEMMDVLMETSSLSGLPGISIPCGLSEDMPVGLQFIGKHFDEQLILDLAYAFEQAD